MINSPKKKLKINEYEYKVINHEEKESIKEELYVNQNKIINNTNDCENRKIWLYDKISNIYENLKLFKKIDDNEENKKNNKRSFEDISKNSQEIKKTGNFRSSFGYLSLLKSLLHIYRFYTTNDVEYYVSSSINSKYLKEKNCIFKDGINDNEEDNKKNFDSYMKKEYSTENYKIQEKETYNDNFSDIFAEVLSEKSGLFFIFNTIFFTNLKKYYYFVDIVNILNYIGNNKSINKVDEKNKDILIYEQIALFIENNYDVLFYDKKNSDDNLENKNNNKISQYKLIESVNKKSKYIEQIKRNLENLKKKKSYEELLYISMNECNKKIYHEFSKIPDLFRDISEMSEYSKNEVIHYEHHDQRTHHLDKEIHTLYNDKNNCSSLICRNLKNNFNFLNCKSLKNNNLSLSNDENSIIHKRNKEFIEENSKTIENISHKSIIESERTDNNNNNNKVYRIKKFLMNIFKRSKMNDNLNNENEIGENTNNEVHLNENINVVACTLKKENTEDSECKGKYNYEKKDFIKNDNDIIFREIENCSNSEIKYKDEVLPSCELSKTEYCNYEVKEQKVYKNEKFKKECKINIFENNESTNSESNIVGSINNDLTNKELENAHFENKGIKINESINECIEKDNSKNINDDIHNELINLKELNSEKKECIKESNSICKEINEIFNEELKNKEINENKIQNSKTKDDDDDEFSDNAQSGKEYSHQIEIEHSNSEECISEEKSKESEIQEKDSIGVMNTKNKEVDENDFGKEKKKLENNNTIENKSDEIELSYDESNGNNKLNEVVDNGNQYDDEVEENENESNESNSNNNHLNEDKSDDSQSGSNPTNEEVSKDNQTKDSKSIENESNEEINSYHTNEDEGNNNNNSDDNKSNENQVYDNYSIEDKPNNNDLNEYELDDNKKLDEEESNDIESNENELNEDEVYNSESDDNKSESNKSNESDSNNTTSNNNESDDSDLYDNQLNENELSDNESNDRESYKNTSDENESNNNGSDYYSEESNEGDNHQGKKKNRINITSKKYELEKIEESYSSDNILSFDKVSLSNEIDDEQIINFLKYKKKNTDTKKYREYLKNILTCDKTCSIKDHASEKDTFIKKIKKLCDLIKNKKFKDKYMNYWKCKVHFKCCKLQRAYKIFLMIICSMVKEINKLTKELNDMSNFIFINSGIENYLNENNISVIEKSKSDNDLIENYFSENNIINDFFFNENFSKEEKKKKYISYIPLENYRILLLCLRDIFNEKNLVEQLKNISYYIEFDNYIPNYCNSFYDKFKINYNYLYHIQSLYHNSVPTIECINMFISCLNYNYSKIHKKKPLFKYDLNNNYLLSLPFVYCCDVQIIRHLEFLKLKETCQKIIKNNKIYEKFLNHLFSYIFDESYFIIPFFTSYGKFLIIIKTNRNKNTETSIDSLKNKNSITYDVIINSFVFPNDSSFHAIIHFSHIFIKCLKNFFKTRNSDENIPEISFANLLNIEKQQIIYQEIETSKNRNEIIINMLFLIESFFNNTKKIRVPKEFNQGLRFLYITRLIEFFHKKDLNI
ncbi:conserved Plasmodium protein, unknown function [Plasmodium relictum]|uniref:Uncharacterized protein n=1 Tax=Plasmodium relictum TaxID=85471 RepID=A0A1J1HBI2_PLARL|nr:conserved Plasmodium protein, unknown function [Plasmodium relictum]CRH02812.1 conserved Plasmodium protein, unknown function [Plasmodium relictum]